MPSDARDSSLLHVTAMETATPLLDTDAPPRHSQYGLTRNELTKAVANRFVHSRVYVALYLVMAALSATTVGLSLADGCPGMSFYILEIIVNTAMIAEVTIRFLAFGRVSPLANPARIN